MNTTTKDRAESDIRYRAVQQLLHQPGPVGSQAKVDSLATRSIQALERQAPRLVADARAAGVELEYLGITDLFSETRHYAGEGTDWVLAPVTSAEQAVVPARERRQLAQLARAGIDVPLVYIADEIAKEKTAHLPAPQSGGYAVLDHGVGKELVGPIPEPHRTVAEAGRLGHASQQLLTGVLTAGRAVGVAAAAAAMAPVAALAALATMDPIILGAIPARRGEVGEPGAWFILARWDW